MTQGFVWMYPDERYYYEWYGDDPADRPSDAEIKAQLVERLRGNALTADDYIDVDVKRGVVILTGDVSSPVAKRAAGDDAWDTLGVSDVSNQLHVQKEPTAQSSGSDSGVRQLPQVRATEPPVYAVRTGVYMALIWTALIVIGIIVVLQWIF